MEIEVSNQNNYADENIYDITINGYKHSLVLLLSAIIVLRGRYLINNVPNLFDTKVYIKILRLLNCSVLYYDNSLYIDSRYIKYCDIPNELLESIHGTIYLMPAFLEAFKCTNIFKTGGCQIGEESEINGKRPIKHIISVMEKFGARKEDSYMLLEDDLQNTQVEIDISEYYVDNICKGPSISGATKTAILLALTTKRTILHNAYTAADVCDLLGFISQIGFDVIFDIEKGEICIEQKTTIEKDSLVDFEIISDQTELLTYIVAGIICNKNVRIYGHRFLETIKFFKNDLLILNNMNIKYELGDDCIYVFKNQILFNTDIVFMPNGILSDHQPLYCLLLTLANGVSNITDDVWENRFDYLDGLYNLGCKIERIKNHICIYPRRPYRDKNVLCGTDLRAEAALLLAALSVNGKNILKNVSHIWRGYEDLIGVLNTFKGVEICEK